YTPPPVEDDDWLLDHKLRLLQRKLNISHSDSPGKADAHNSVFGATVERAAFPFLSSGANPSSGGTSNCFASDLGGRARSAKKKEKRRPAVLAWIILSLGLMSFVCGGVLLAWSFVGHRNDLWAL